MRYPSVTFFAAELSQIHQFMRRRAFITLLGNAIASPLAARAQATVKLPIIGFLFADPTISTPWIAAFVERLKALDWIEGPTVIFEHRWSNGPDRDAEIAAEFVGLPVAVILTDGPSVPIVKRATSLFPSSSLWRAIRSAAA